MKHAIQQLAETFRARATAVESKHGKLQWTQTINVIEAFEQCAAALESLAPAAGDSAPRAENPKLETRNPKPSEA